MGSMLEMMKGMMGQGQGQGEGEGEGKGEGEGEGKGDKESNSGGEGQEGSSDKPSDKTKTGLADNTKEERRVPKNTSAPSNNLPREEQRALDAYNRRIQSIK